MGQSENRNCKNCDEKLTRNQKSCCDRECLRAFRLKTHKRVCKTCGKTPLEVEFGALKTTIDGLRTICKRCDSSRATELLKNHSDEKKSARLERGRSDKYKNTVFKKKFGITMDFYKDLLNRQLNCCAICKSTFHRENFPNVDHNHETGQVRGLLCRMCNLGLGHFKDDPSKITKAIKYLEESFKEIHIAKVKNLLAKRKDEVRYDMRRTRKMVTSSKEGRIRLLEYQNFKCASCEDDLSHLNFRKINIDHNHAKMFIRGALCKHCNIGLGLFFENVSHLLAAIKYLENYSK